MALLAVPAAASAAPDFTWSGLAPVGTPNWSSAANWVGGITPSDPVGTLTFPILGSSDCAGFPPHSATCYDSQNDVPGINVNAIEIGGGGYGAAYGIGGAPIVLGDGGITVTPDIQATAWTASEIDAPISLSAPQTWTINGTSYVGWLYLNSEVSGPSNALDVSLNNGNVAVGADVETGSVSLTGNGSVYLGSALGPHYVGTLNGSDGNPVSIGEGVSMFDQNTNRYAKNAHSVGALTVGDNAFLQVGQPETSGAVTLPVNGGITLSPASHLSLLFNSQISATGPVNLADARLSLEDGSILIDGSLSCNVLIEDRLLTTTGSLTGTFQGIPDGTVIPLQCIGLTVPPEVRINYTAHAVTATLVQRTTTTLDVSSRTPTVGQSVTYTATETPERSGVGVLVPSGSVKFLDGGQPIAGCSGASLTPGQSTASARCDTSYQTLGTHTITVTYPGAPTYAGSASAPETIVVQAAAPAPHQPRRHGVSLASATIPVQGDGVASIKLDCTGQARCHGTLTLTTRPKHETRATTIGTASFSIHRGEHETEITLNGAGRRLLRLNHGQLGAILTITSPTGGQHERVRVILKGSGKTASKQMRVIG